MTEEIQRRIPLEGCVNFRDLGGYPTADGRKVKWRRLFRSDAPNTLTEALPVFSPSTEDVKHWQGLVKAMEEMRATGGAAVTYGGNMVDIAHEATARTMLAIAKEMEVEGA